MQETPSQDSGRDDKSDDEGHESAPEAPLTPEQVQRDLEEIITGAGLPRHVVLGTSEYSTLQHAWPRAVGIALLETLSQRTFTVHNIAQKLLPLSHFGLVVNAQSVQLGLQRHGGTRKYAAALSAERYWTKVGVPAKEQLVALARKVVREVDRQEKEKRKARPKVRENLPVAEFQQNLSAIADRYSIAEGKIRGPKDRSTLSYGWPRALLAAALETMAGTMPSVAEIMRIVSALSAYDVVLDGMSVRQHLTAAGSIVNAAHELLDQQRWPEASREAREDLLRLARTTVKGIEIPSNDT